MLFIGLLNILFALEASGQESAPTLNAAMLDQALAFIAKPKMSAPNCPDLKPKKQNEEIILESICRAPNSKDKQPALDSKNPSRLVYVATDPNQIPKEFAERIPLQSIEVREKTRSIWLSPWTMTIFF